MANFSIYKSAIFNGLAVALAGSVLMISLLGLKLIGPKAISLDTEMIGGTILFLMLYLFLLFAIYLTIKKRKEHNEQKITFKEALLQGTVLSISTALSSVLLTYLFYEILYPNYVTDMLNSLQAKMQSLNIDPEKLQQKLAEKKEYYSTSTQSSYSFIGNLITGISFTLLLSFILKSNKK
jgi:predicted membrane protein